MWWLLEFIQFIFRILIGIANNDLITFIEHDLLKTKLIELKISGGWILYICFTFRINLKSAQCIFSIVIYSNHQKFPLLQPFGDRSQWSLVNNTSIFWLFFGSVYQITQIFFPKYSLEGLKLVLYCAANIKIAASCDR